MEQKKLTSQNIQDLVSRFNAEIFSPKDAEGSLESGPDFNFKLFEATGKTDCDWIEVKRPGFGMVSDQYEWIRNGTKSVEMKENPEHSLDF